MPVDITATKPASQPGNPSWATNGGTRVAPTLGHKQTGFTNAERPSFNLFNWLIGFLADWAKYLEDATDELDAGKLSVTGANDMTGNLLPNVDNAHSLGDVILRWAVGAFVSLSATTLSLVTKVTIGVTDVLTETMIKLAATADTKATARTNSLNTRSMPKAWASITTDGAGHAAGNVVINDGFNISGVVFHNYSTGYELQLTFASNFAANGGIAAPANCFIATLGPLTAGNAFSLVVTATPIALGTITLTVWDVATGAQADLSTIGVTINIVAFGVQ